MGAVWWDTACCPLPSRVFRSVGLYARLGALHQLLVARTLQMERMNTRFKPVWLIFIKRSIRKLRSNYLIKGVRGLSSWLAFLCREISHERLEIILQHERILLRALHYVSARALAPFARANSRNFGTSLSANIEHTNANMISRDAQKYAFKIWNMPYHMRLKSVKYSFIYAVNMRLLQHKKVQKVRV